MAQTQDSLLNEAVEVAVEAHASALADANEVESAWFLRGVLDALKGVHNDESVYRRYYEAGYVSVLNARAKVEV